MSKAKVIDCALESPGTLITVGQKLKLVCKTEGLAVVTPQSKIEFSNLSPGPEHALAFLGEPVVGPGQVEQFVASYRPGNHEFSGIKLSVDGKDFAVSRQNLEVGSVLPEGKQAPTPYPIFDPFKVAAPWWWWALWGLLLLLAVFVVMREFFKWRKRRLLLNNLEVVKLQTPQERFLSQMRRLESKGLHQKGEYKLFALELTQILKAALAAHYRINAEDMTSEELVATLERRQKIFFQEAGNLMQSVLSSLDQIKFAKVETTTDKCLLLLDQVSQLGQILFRSVA